MNETRTTSPRRDAGDASASIQAQPTASASASGGARGAPQWVYAASGARATQPGQAPDPANAAEVRRLLLAFGLTEAQVEAASKADPLLWHYECATPCLAHFSVRRSSCLLLRHLSGQCHGVPQFQTNPTHAQRHRLNHRRKRIRAASLRQATTDGNRNDPACPPHTARSPAPGSRLDRASRT